MKTDWFEAADGRAHATREFRIRRAGERDITGAVWTAAVLAPDATLVCFGHGASGDRYQAPIPYLAARFVTEAGLPVLSLDGPVHGLRQTGPGGRASFFPEFQREACIRDMTDDWTLAIDAVRARLALTGRLAYFGLSMGSIFGIPLIASRDDVTAATLGLIGVDSGFPHDEEILDACGAITCPLLFLMQLEDELFTREGYLRVFDAIPSNDKRLHANPGLHPEIPAEELDFAFEFLRARVEGRASRRIVNPLAE